METEGETDKAVWRFLYTAENLSNRCQFYNILHRRS